MMKLKHLKWSEIEAQRKIMWGQVSFKLDMKHRNGMDDDAYDCMRSPKEKKKKGGADFSN
jgi:hypothetical protein